MAQAMINFRMDEELKKNMEETCKDLGLSMTAAINMYLKRILMEQGIPFDVSARTPNATTIAAMDEFEEIKKNPSAYKRYPNFKAALSEVL